MTDTIEVDVAEVSVNGAVDQSRTWNYDEGLYLLSDTAREQFVSEVSQEKYGHLSLKRSLYQAFKADQRAKAHLMDVQNSLTHERKAIDLETATRNKNRKFLSTLPDDVLEQYCTKYNVSMQSFLSRGDRLGLLEAIVDEMLI